MIPSPNHGPRLGGGPIDMVVIHYTAMSDAEGAIRHLCDPASEVSCHWVIDRNGRAVQLVSEERRAWHAGAGRWGTVRDVNSRSVGVELDNDGFSAFPEVQLAALIALVRGIRLRHPAITPERIVGHSCVAPWRKNDPGPFFPWKRLAEAGLAIWPKDAGRGPVETLPANLSRIGFPAGPTPEAVRLRGFRLRWRPERSGRVGPDGPVIPPADEIDAGLAAAIAARWPVAGGPDPMLGDALDPMRARA